MAGSSSSSGQPAISSGSTRQRLPMCSDCEKSLPNQIVFDKIESIITLMQDERNGLPVKTAKSFMSKIPSVFTGTDLIQWMMRNLKLEDQQEALHLANLIASHGYIFPIEDHTLSIKSDATFYRFQTPYLWPSNNMDPENTDYAVYLCKRTMQGKTRLELADYEAENLARLQKMFSRKWEFIFMQAESQAKVDKKRDKLERKVLDSQERAFWDVYRPVPGCVNTTEMDIKKACRLSKTAKRCNECQKVGAPSGASGINSTTTVTTTTNSLPMNTIIEASSQNESEKSTSPSPAGDIPKNGESEKLSENSETTKENTTQAPISLSNELVNEVAEIDKLPQVNEDDILCVKNSLDSQEARQDSVGDSSNLPEISGAKTPNTTSETLADSSQDIQKQQGAQHKHHHHHHHHHHPHGHPHCHNHHHHHHHNHHHHHHHRQCPHLKHNQQKQNLVADDPSSSKEMNDEKCSAPSGPEQVSGGEQSSDHHGEGVSSSAESASVKSDRDSRRLCSKKRSVGSVDNHSIIRVPSVSSSVHSACDRTRRRSECHRMLSVGSEPQAVIGNSDRPASACGSTDTQIEKPPTGGSQQNRLLRLPSEQAPDSMHHPPNMLTRKSSLNILPRSLDTDLAQVEANNYQEDVLHRGNLERELEALKIRVDRRLGGGVKMSKVTQSYLSYFNQWAEYDPFIAQPIPSNPWISDSTELWDFERQTKDVHSRRVRRWAFSLKELLNDPAGREQFHKFLEKEFSAENLKFWDAVQELKRIHSRSISRRVEAIWNEYLAQDANCPINIDSKSYETSKKNMAKNKNNRYIFDEAAGHVYQLMKNDSYPRYLRSDLYKDYKEASERRRPNQVTYDLFKPQITTLKHKFNF